MKPQFTNVLRFGGLSHKWSMNKTAKMLRPEQVAELISVSTRTLARWRCDGTGPAWLKVGRVIRYPSVDLEEWKNHHISN